MADDKKLAKLEKKRKKAEIKAIKKQLKEASDSGKSPVIREIVREAPKEKDWRSNVWKYTVVAIVIAIIAWAVTTILSKYVG